MRRAVLALAACLVACLIVACGHTTSHRSVAASARAQSAMGSVHPPGWGQTPPGFSAPRVLPTATPTAEMLDGIYVSDFHGLQPFATAGYTAGFWPDYLGLRAAFPTAHTVSIAIAARWHADCLDVEPGDAVPSQAGPWVVADIQAGFPKPCVYGDLSEMPSIKASLAASLGSTWRSRVFLWLAWYRFIPGLVAGYDAVQWTDHGSSITGTSGRNLDESTVTLSFLSIAQPPYVAPAPAPKPKPASVVCLTHRMSQTQCAAVKAKLAGYGRAILSSQRAHDATAANVARLLKLEGVFAGRVRYFTGKARALVAAS